MKSPSMLLLLAVTSTLVCPARAQDAAIDTEVENVVITGSRIHVPDRRPEDKIAFPEIKDWSTLKIGLVRGRCLGGLCPDYFVEVRGDGSVTYRGGDAVAVSGEHHFQIPKQRARAVVEAFRKAEFFWLYDAYLPPASDARWEEVSIAFDGREKTVVEAAGDIDGLPAAVYEAMDAIDNAVDIKTWIAGDTEAFAALKAEGWDFHSRDDGHTRLLGAAAQTKKLVLLASLLDAGVPVDTRGGCEALANAAYNRDLATVQLLVAKGASSYWPDPAGKRTCSALSAALTFGGGTTVEIVKEILKLHPDVNLNDGHYTPLTSLSIRAAVFDNEIITQEARLLIEAGADPNVLNADGRPALLYCYGQPDMVSALVKAGARVDFQDKDGRTALMSSSKPEGTQVLLKGGANPYLKDKAGKTALAHARSEWGTAPLLKAWMAAHPKSAYRRK
jgi:ankyrin repeat protein